MKNKLQKLKYKIVKRLINRSCTAMQIVIEYRNEVADFYEHYLDVANDEMDKLERKRLDVLDKIRAEIEQLPITDTAIKLVAEILDKYKSESEVRQ